MGVDLVPHPGEEIIEAAGGAVLPGLHDHHVHLRALAAAAGSVMVGPPEVRTEAEMAATLRRAVVEAGGRWVRAVGYHESVAGLLDCADLDRYTGGAPVPVRVQHRSGALWVLNSAGMEALQLGLGAPTGVERDEQGRPTGRLWRVDGWLAGRVPHAPLNFGRVGQQAAAVGITGFTDATPDQRPEDLAALVETSRSGELRQRLHLMAPIGASLPNASDRVGLGPVKVILDDPALPSLADLTAIIGAARAEDRAVAVHCVTLVQAVLTLAAFEAVEAVGSGPTDRRSGPHRIEHGAVITPGLFERIRRLGLTVVTQPGLVAARGDDYLTDVDPVEQDDLWRAGSLVDAGVALAGGTDAPFGPPDPWLGIRAAITRRTAGGSVLGAGERLSPMAAFGLWTGRPDQPAVSRRIRPGETADLCVLAEPLDAALSGEGPPSMAATIVAGEVVHRAR
jgi:predicted amidohydrolase YtcJ